jgi:hypothetical protein
MRATSWLAITCYPRKNKVFLFVLREGRVKGKNWQVIRLLFLSYCKYCRISAFLNNSSPGALWLQSACFIYRLYHCNIYIVNHLQILEDSAKADTSLKAKHFREVLKLMTKFYKEVNILDKVQLVTIVQLKYNIQDLLQRSKIYFIYNKWYYYLTGFYCLLSDR